MFGRLALALLTLAGGAFAAIEGPSSMVRGTDPEDSLQNLVQQDPDNPSHWVGLGQLALKGNQDDLAKGYFDEAIKLSKSSADPILRIGLAWLESGKVETSLPYLLPNLSHLETPHLSRLEKSLEARHPSVAILVLRHHAARGKSFSPEVRRAGELAFRAGQFELCRDILSPYADGADSVSVRLMLLSGFYSSKAPDEDAVQRAVSRFPAPDIRTFAALNLALLGDFKAARGHSEAQGSTTPAPVRSYIQAREQAAADRIEEAQKLYEAAQNSNWPEFREIATAELYRFFSITGNGYKAEQVWSDLKERDSIPSLKEFLARHLSLRGYEKQARYLYKSLYRSNPGRAGVLKALWDEMIETDPDGLGAQMNALLGVDPLNCDANQLAMRYYIARNQSRDVVHHGRNVVLYCYEVVEPYFDLATALMSLSKPDEARTYFGKYVKSGGDKKRIPTYMR